MTIRDRVSVLCKYSLERRLTSLRLNPVDGQEKYIYRSMVSADSLLMGLFSLASLLSCSRQMPRIELCVDESLVPEEVSRFFAGHGLAVEVITASELDDSLAKREQTLLRKFAKSFFWGRKTAFTFGYGADRPVLYADLDVLWFKDPWTGIGMEDISTILAGTDQCHTYDPGLVGILSPTHRELLTSTTPVCAGIYAFHPAFCLPAEANNYITRQLEAGTPGHFCEQTILALTVKLAGQQIPHQRLPTCPPGSTLWPAFQGQEWVGAHYAGPTRPQFWRDAWSRVWF